MSRLLCDQLYNCRRCNFIISVLIYFTRSCCWDGGASPVEQLEVGIHTGWSPPACCIDARGPCPPSDPHSRGISKGFGAIRERNEGLCIEGPARAGGRTLMSSSPAANGATRATAFASCMPWGVYAHVHPCACPSATAHQSQCSILRITAKSAMHYQQDNTCSHGPQQWLESLMEFFLMGSLSTAVEVCPPNWVDSETAAT
jgi:hypothetical protein